MNDGFLRDRNGNILGRFDGNWLRDREGRLISRYDESDDRTRKATGEIVGSGDLRLFELARRNKG